MTLQTGLSFCSYLIWIFRSVIHLRHLKAATRGPVRMVQAFTDPANPDQPRGSFAGLMQGP